MTQVNRRLVKGAQLTITEGDESLEHLSNATLLTSDAQLYTGGVYQSEGTLVLTMPADGNMVLLEIKSGTAQLIGNVNGVVNPTYPPGRMYTYTNFGGLWRVADSSSNTVTTFTASTIANTAFPKVAIDSHLTTTFTIPEGLPENTLFGVIRRNETVNVVTEGSETIYDPGTNSYITLLEINLADKFVWLYRDGPTWFYAT